MSLEAGARTIVEQCLDVQPDEYTVVVNDGNDPDLFEALLDVLDERVAEYEYLEYEEPERHGEEPPESVAEEMRRSDVFIAPTRKSLSHTAARREANAEGSRGATLPGINREIWTGALLADYQRVAEISEEVHELLVSSREVEVTTPSGTELSLEVEPEYYSASDGIIREPGEFSNLPAGEAFGAPVKTSGRLVIDYFPFAPEGTVVEIEDNEAVAVQHPGEEESRLAEAFEEVEGSRNVAEFGVGTNPEAELIGNTLQDEKVLGTVHFAFGDNSSMVPEADERRVETGLHWDAVCEDPTLRLDGTLVMEEGDPLFG
ncbi:MAG: aminopeptidase [Candidatus Nanohaloarchaea archaeon]